MDIAYLGLFEKIFNWVLDKIFNPIFKWLSDLLNTVFTWIFNEILSPILLPLLETVMEFTINLFMQIYGQILYSLFAGILRLIDYMEIAFDVFIGIRDVTYGNEQGPLIDILLRQDTISTIFWLLTISGLAIALVLTIYGTAQSAFDLDFENKRPVSRVLTSMMKTFIQFFTVPFFVYFMVRLSAEILKAATTALQGDTGTTLGRIVFVIASLNAAQDANLNVKTAPDSVNPGISDRLREPYYSGAKDYANIELVGTEFHFSDFDYLIGIVASVFLLLTLAICLIKFVQRLFEIILLYITSPYFVSMMPLDDGERFNRWRDLFIGKCFTGFGSAIAMRLYLIVCPMIMGNRIRFGVSSSTEMDYLLKLFFLIGGAWAVYKSGPLLTTLLSSSAGQAEDMTQAAAGGAIYRHTAGKGIAKMKNLAQSGFRGSARSGKGAGKDPGAAFTGTKKTAAAAMTTSKLAKSPQEKKLTSTKSADKLTVNPQTRKLTSTKATDRLKVDWQGNKAATDKQTANAQTKKLTSTKATDRLKVDWQANKAAGLQGSGASDSSAKDTAYNGNGRGIRLGSVFQNSYDENGNHKIRVLGMGVTRNAAGETTAVRLPGMKLRQVSDGGRMQVSKFHVPGVVNVKSNIADGKLYHSDISVLGVHVSNTSDGVGVNVGKIHYSNHRDGTTFSYGSGISVEKAHGKSQINSLNIGKLEYNRDGSITKKKKTGGQ